MKKIDRIRKDLKQWEHAQKEGGYCYSYCDWQEVKYLLRIIDAKRHHIWCNVNLNSKACNCEEIAKRRKEKGYVDRQ